MERGAVQSLRDRVECFDNKKGCSLQHVRRWLNIYQLLSQPENQRMTQNIREMMKMVYRAEANYSKIYFLRGL
jgi:hypothetical protein